MLRQWKRAMEAAKLSCIGSPLSLCLSPSTSSKRVLCAVKPSPSPISSLSCDRPPSPSFLSPQLSIFSVVDALANLVCLPALASEEALESSLSSLSSSPLAEAASTQVPDSTGASSVQSSVESTVQSSVQSVNAAAAADGGDGNLIITILGTASFIGLCGLTIGVVYLFVGDFLEKRKRNEEVKKLTEEEARVKKRPSGSLSGASRGGAKGFGKKREVDE